jgi:predicted dehydrogenase
MMDNYKPKYVVGSVYRKLADRENAANAFGSWDPKEFTVEDSAFGYIVMENGAVVTLDASWALNIAEPKEATFLICGVNGGIDSLDGVRVNYVRNGRQAMEKPDLNVGGVAFYDGKGVSASELDMRKWIDAVINDKPQCVLPEQALCVTRILEAIYTSAKTGKPVYFED